MEKGSLRCDANVSVRPRGSDELRPRWELKNMNSFNFIARGIDRAVGEQIALYERGDEPVQDTYDFDAAAGTLTRHRSKEEADDYRYFPEPDLVPLEPPRELVERLRADLPELPAARIRRLEDGVGLELAADLVGSGRDRLYERLLSADALEPRLVANAVMNEIAGAGVDPEAVNAEELAKVLRERERLPRDVYAEAIAASASPGFAAARYLEQSAITDAAESKTPTSSHDVPIPR
jgi:aspartyl-tRNA(Asn)/glutamyl-tRNA(Gln) amidotransferase subunit B